MSTLPGSDHVGASGAPGDDDAVAAVLAAAVSLCGTGDWETAVAAVAELLDRGVDATHVLHNVVTPLQTEAGRRWADNEWGVAEVRVATSVSGTVVTLLDCAEAGRERHGQLLVACAEGEHHDLPAAIVAADLRRAGWGVTLLGASVPASDLRRFVVGTGPDAVLLSCSTPWSLPGLARSVAAVRDTGTRVIVGGSALGRNPVRARRLGADGWATSARAATHLLQELPKSPSPRRLRAGTGPALDEGGWLDRHQDHVVQLATGAVHFATGSSVDAPPAGLAELVGSLAGALVVTDEPVLDEFVDWLVAFLARRGHSVNAVYSLLDAVRSVLPPDLQHTGALLGRTIDRLAADHPGVAAALDATTTIKTAVHTNAATALPVPANEAARVSAVAAYDLDGGALKTRFDDLVSMAAAVCDAPMAFLSIVDGERQWFPATHGASFPALDRTSSLCAFTIARREVVVIPDLSFHPSFEQHALVADGPRLRGYAAAPLLAASGHAIGTLGVVDYVARLLRDDQRRYLETLANNVMAELELDRRTRADATRAGSGPADRLLARVVDLRRPDGEGGAESGLLTTRDLARLFQVSPRTVTNWAAQGRLRAVQTAGGHYRFDPDDVLAFLLESPAVVDGGQVTGTMARKAGS
ncbi:MAG TPA: cobalamin-dependent protein [Acidimicrobiales bacterium]|nr:cobalamin-dependent protein [Acidimicrobiales bacterium]